MSGRYNAYMDKLTHLLLIDIDGLRHDVFQKALREDAIPNIAALLGGPTLANGVEMAVASTASSITFAAQASLFTGAHPARHGIPGNQFFDRFGRYGDGTPRHYAFDVGDTLAYDDAIGVFSHGLASGCLQVPTLYQKWKQERGWRSVVSGNMYAAGADTWLKPSLVDIARFTKGGSLLGLGPADFDRKMLNNTLAEIEKNGLPEVLTVYFMGLDSTSHKKGPGSQYSYLVEQIEPKIGRLWDCYRDHLGGGMPLVALFSDHGQIEVVPEDRYSLRLSFPFERELGHLFDALGLDVHDYPGEDPHCDAVVASNGGLAYVYLQNRIGRWADAPRFQEDVLPVAKAFWEAHQTGKYATEVQGSLDSILIRNVEAEGWDAPYHVLTPQGEIVSKAHWFGSGLASGQALDPVNRLRDLAGPMAGDMILVSNYEDGFYFAPPQSGTHGGLHPDDSLAVLAFGFPKLSKDRAEAAGQKVKRAIQARCQAEGGRYPSIVDLASGLNAVL